MDNSFGDFRYKGPYYDPGYFFRKEKEKRDLHQLGVYTGAAVLLSVLFQYILVFILQIFRLQDRYYADAYFSSAVDIIIVVVGMLLPFVFVGRKMKKVSGTAQPLMLEAPRKKALMIPAVFAGLGFCMLGNIINSYITAFFSSMNVEFSSPDIPMAEGVSGVILTFFRVAITAAIVEELAFRGVVMGNLRFYGDGFAIAVSSVVFALMHGNMVQAPFALMAGFALGYLSVKTGTIWTGVIIHLLNNSFSTVIYYLGEAMTEEELLSVYISLLFVTITLGAVSFAYFSFRTRKNPVSKGGSVLETGEKVKAYFLNVPMVLTIAYMLYVTADYISMGN